MTPKRGRSRELLGSRPDLRRYAVALFRPRFSVTSQTRCPDGRPGWSSFERSGAHDPPGQNEGSLNGRSNLAPQQALIVVGRTAIAPLGLLRDVTVYRSLPFNVRRPGF